MAVSSAHKRSPGAGQWRALTLVEVTATGKSYRKEVKVTLSRYVAGEVVVEEVPPAEEDS